MSDIGSSETPEEWTQRVLGGEKRAKIIPTGSTKPNDELAMLDRDNDEESLVFSHRSRVSSIRGVKLS